jgi:hypothetical protein
VISAKTSGRSKGLLLLSELETSPRGPFDVVDSALRFDVVDPALDVVASSGVVEVDTTLGPETLDKTEESSGSSDSRRIETSTRI